jgi:hypothetical protein
LTDQISSGAEFVAIGESDFIFFDTNNYNTKRISRWSPTTDTLTFLPNFSVEMEMPQSNVLKLDGAWGYQTWPKYITPKSFLDVDGITHIPVRYMENSDYYFDGTSPQVRNIYVFAIFLSTYDGESFTMTEIGRLTEGYNFSITNNHYKFWPAIGGGFFFIDLESRVNTINTNCQEIVHVL